MSYMIEDLLLVYNQLIFII